VEGYPPGAFFRAAKPRPVFIGLRTFLPHLMNDFEFHPHAVLTLSFVPMAPENHLIVTQLITTSALASALAHFSTPKTRQARQFVKTRRAGAQ
jgi:hypothetical protein